MKIEIKKIVFLILLISLFQSGHSQENKAKQEDKAKKDFWQKVYVGGNLGLQFGTIISIDISPLVGYNINDHLSVGVGATYLFFKYNQNSFSVYGGRIFSRYHITSNIFAHVEYEVLNRQDPYLTKERVNIANVLVGGGYRQALSEKSYVNILVLWNINQSDYSIYTNPIIRAGVVIGL